MSTSMKNIRSFSSHWPAPNSKAKARAKLVFACGRGVYGVILSLKNYYPNKNIDDEKKKTKEFTGFQETLKKEKNGSAKFNNRNL